MSHISKIELEIRDLATLKAAASRLGLDFVPGQTTFQGYYRADPCAHAIRVPDGRFEIGIVVDQGKYELHCDYFDPAISQAIGPNGGLLKQAYAVEKAKAEARRRAYSVIEEQVEGRLRLHIRVT